MKEQKPRDKLTQRMTRDGAVLDNQTTGEEIHISGRDAEKQLSPSGQLVQMDQRSAPLNPAEDAPKRRQKNHPQEQAKKPEQEPQQPQQANAEPFPPPSSRPVSHIPQDIPTSAAPGGTAEKLFDRAAAEHDAHKARQAARMSRNAAQQRYRKGKDLCTTHSIKNVVLHEIVLRNLREAIAYVSEHEAEFAQEAAESDMRDRDAEFVRKRETLAKADARIAELDRIISRLYEDNVIGKLSDERFIKMSHDYELEQSNLKSMAEVLRKDLKQQEQQKTNVKEFIAAVKKYTDLQELDAAVLRAFIDRIEVSHVDKKSRTREITIVYNFIGAFDFTRAIENARNTSKKEQRTA